MVRRDAGSLDRAAAELRAATGATVIPVVADVASAEGQAALIAAVPQVDILVTNNGRPPYRDFRQLDRPAMLAGVVNNMVAPIELIQRAIDGMVERRFGRIVNITSGCRDRSTRSASSPASNARPRPGASASMP